MKTQKPFGTNIHPPSPSIKKRLSNKDIAVHECTGRFMRSLFNHYLGTLYDVLCFEEPQVAGLWGNGDCGQYGPMGSLNNLIADNLKLTDNGIYFQNDKTPEFILLIV